MRDMARRERKLAAMRRATTRARPWPLGLAAYAVVTGPLTLAWGVWGWAMPTLCTGVMLLRAAQRAGRVSDHRDGDEGSKALVALPVPVDPLEAELLCQALERAGIPASYFGRATRNSRVPGGGIAFGSARRSSAGVLEADVERALEIASRLNQKEG